MSKCPLYIVVYTYSPSYKYFRIYMSLFFQGKLISVLLIIKYILLLINFPSKKWGDWLRQLWWINNSFTITSDSHLFILIYLFFISNSSNHTISPYLFTKNLTQLLDMLNSLQYNCYEMRKYTIQTIRSYIRYNREKSWG